MKLDLLHIVPREIYTKSGNKVYSLNIAKSGERVIISRRKDKWHNFYHTKEITVPKDNLCLWYFWPTGRNQNQTKNSGLRYKHLIIPRNLPLDKLSLNALGLLQAEMTKGNIRKSTTSFTNSEPNLINIILRFFKRFGIKEDDWSWSLVFNFKLKILKLLIKLSLGKRLLYHIG